MKIKLIVNPSSGKQMVQKNLDKMIGNLILKAGVRCIDVFTMSKKDDAFYEVQSIQPNEYDCILAVGGDGTVNEVINGVMVGKIDTPIAILPAGTVNDFSKYLKIPTNIEGFCEMIRLNKKRKMDVGKAGEKYFINVLAGGLLTDVGYKVSSDIKTVLGKYAYYVEGMKEIPKKMFKSISIDMDIEGFKQKEDILMFIITNTPSVGGFKKLAPKAQLDDGLLDVIIVKKLDLPELFSLFLHTMKGEHINHPNVLYFQTNKIKLNSTKNHEIPLDIDGEEGGTLPVCIEVVEKALEFIVP